MFINLIQISDSIEGIGSTEAIEIRCLIIGYFNIWHNYYSYIYENQEENRSII